MEAANFIVCNLLKVNDADRQSRGLVPDSNWLNAAMSFGLTVAHRERLSATRHSSG